MGPSDVMKLCRDEGVEVVDYRFMDFPGLWQHYSVPVSELSEEIFRVGRGFDGSSIRGWQAINESDMIVRPDAKTAFIDPFFKHKTLVLICDIVDPRTGQDYTRDPRHVAIKAENYLKTTGLGDTAFFGPEAEFFIFDDVRFDCRQNMAFYSLDSDEGAWNTGRDEDGRNPGYKIRYKGGYFPVPPMDSQQDLRSEMMMNMIACGMDVECQHHEVATGGQAEIDLRFDSLVAMADKILKFKYIIKNTARQYGKTVTFMPKPLFGDNGSGMHCHLSIWKNGKNMFYGNKYANLSDNAIYAIGGLLHHAPSLLAITNPTTNSYKRLVPGYEAPVNLAYSASNRSACIRIPMFNQSEKAKRIEFRCPDPSCNPYLGFAAILMAAIDGIENKIDPGLPMDKNIYDLPPEELAKIPQAPGSLREALNNLEKDHDYLLKGDVFTQDVIETWIDYKIENECLPVETRPHPQEFAMYFDI